MDDKKRIAELEELVLLLKRRNYQKEDEIVALMAAIKSGPYAFVRIREGTAQVKRAEGDDIFTTTCTEWTAFP